MAKSDYERGVAAMERINAECADLNSFASDHAMLLAAIVAGVARWEPWRETHKGEVCIDGLRHATWLDPFGCPLLTPGIRAAIIRSGVVGETK